MKVSGAVISYLLVGTLLIFLNFSGATTAFSVSDMALTDGRNIMAATSRKLKGNIYNNNVDKNSDAPDLNLDDYRPIDPVPSSKASIRPGPIEHGTPLNPFIPKPRPSPPPGPPHAKKIG